MLAAEGIECVLAEGHVSAIEGNNGAFPRRLLEAAVGSEAVARYEAALQRLRDEERELIVARLEMQLTYAEVAAATGKPSSNAARMAVTRAVARLIEEMGDVSGPTD